MFKVIQFTFYSGALAMQHMDTMSFVNTGDGASDVLWDGIDIIDADKSKENAVTFGPLDTSHLIEPPVLQTSREGGRLVGVEVLGLQDTGTNLINQLLYHNFKTQLAHFDSTRKDSQKGIWKHAYVKYIDEFCPAEFDNLVKNDVVPIVMVRNPLSWLQSIRKAPYELSHCVQAEGWYGPCTHKKPAGYVDEQVPPFYGQHLSGIWGRWTESYEPVLHSYFKQVIMLRYEDLVLNTTAVLRHVAELLNLTLPDTFDIIESPAKSHGDAVGRAAAIQRIQNREYLQNYEPEELTEICRELKYFSSVTARFSYTDDCPDV